MASASSTRADWRALRRLGIREWCLLAAAAVLLPVTGASLKLLGYRRLERAIRGLPAHPPGRRDAVEVATATNRMVLVAAARLPVGSKCLSRSLVLWGLLRVQGIESELRHGVRRDGDMLGFHAWVGYQGRPLNDAADVGERFETVRAVSSAPD